MGFKNVAKVPISAFKGDNVFIKSENMKWYKGPTLIDTLDNSVKPVQLPWNKPLRACVQDVYGLQDNEIIVCKIETGILEVGKTVYFSPSAKKGTVKSIEMFGSQIEKAKPDIMMIETKTPVIKKHWRIIDDVKKVSSTTNVVLVGDHVTALPKESMENSKVDYVITGGDYDWALAVAYNSMLQAGRGLMFRLGYKPSSTHGRIAVLRFLRILLGEKIDAELLTLLNRARRKRHRVVYEEAEITSRREAEETLSLWREILESLGAPTG